MHWARYVDRLVTVPLLLVALALTATHALPRTRWGVVTAMVAAGIPMVLFGLAADLMASWAPRVILYGLGVLALLVLFGLIWDRSG